MGQIAFQFERHDPLTLRLCAARSEAKAKLLELNGRSVALTCGCPLAVELTLASSTSREPVSAAHDVTVFPAAALR